MNDTNVYINLDNIENNAKEIKEKYNEYKYHIAVLKSSCYGHGEYIINEVEKAGINYVAVSYVDEAIKIRKYNKKINILLLEPVSISDIDKIIKYNLTITISDIDYLNEVLKIVKKTVRVHLKLDTGMNRLGLKSKKDVLYAYEEINKNKYLILEGIYTHFATIGLFDKNYDNQVSKFIELTSLIDLNTIPIVHLGSSVILISHPKLSFVTGVRFGILLYGYNVGYNYSSVGIKNKLRNIRNRYYQKKYNLSKFIYNPNLNLKPAMSMETTILQIKNVRRGESIGYGAHYVADENIKIAVLPIGYNNGIGKNIKYVIINDKKYYCVGEVSMNMMIIKIDDNVRITDKVNVLGNGITLGMLSRFNNWSISETLLNIGKNNKRVYIKNNKIEYIDEIR